MKCPNDGATLVMSERTGIEIDYCPECRGVWLDRGELDKIIDRAGSGPASTEPPAAAGLTRSPQFPDAYGHAQPDYGRPQYDPRRDDRRDDHYGDRRDDHRGYDPRYQDPRYRGKKKRDNWLSDLFD
jgi:uncharacterized protein